MSERTEQAAALPWQPNDALRLTLMAAIDALEAATTEAALLEAIDGPVRDVLPHDGLVCGMADSIPEWNPHCLLLHRFPSEYMDSIRKPDGGYESEMISRWRASRVPVLADPALDTGRWWSDAWMAGATRSGLLNLIGHGFVDVKGAAVSYFCFARVAEPLGPKHGYLMNRLVPHLHLALLRSIGNAPDVRPAFPSFSYRLSHRQLDILKLMKSGKTNIEMSLILSTSEANVKYHVKAIFEKLDAYSRTLAVAKAISLGLISPQG